MMGRLLEMRCPQNLKLTSNDIKYYENLQSSIDLIKDLIKMGVTQLNDRRARCRVVGLEFPSDTFHFPIMLAILSGRGNCFFTFGKPILTAAFRTLPVDILRV